MNLLKAIVEYFTLKYQELLAGTLSFSDIVEVILIAEFLFLCIVAFTSYGVRVYRSVSSTIREIQVTGVMKNLERALRQNHFSGRIEIPWYAQRLSVMVQVLEKLDLYYSSELWQRHKVELSGFYLKKKTIRGLRSWSWKKRNLALRSILLHLELYSEDLVLKALADPYSLNRIHAALCAAKFASKKSINSLIDLMYDSGRFGEFAFQDALKQSSPTALDWVCERYENESNPRIRKICLEILGHKIKDGIIDRIILDCESENRELRLSAIRSLGYQPSKKSLNLLCKKMTDTDWLVRSNAAKSLGKLGDFNAAPYLVKGLQDKEWWVRMNSGIALGNLGVNGRRVLTMQDPDLDRYADDMAQYVLAMGEVYG